MRGCFALVQLLGVAFFLACFAVLRPDAALVVGGGGFLLFMVIGGIGYRLEARREKEAHALRRRR